nr:helix-turn-helix transcriptional regulator [uncultured Campylobacter sp.]
MATISFDKYLDNKLKNDPNFRVEYEAMLPEYELKKQLIEARIKSKMTQEQIAQKMEMKQSNLARFEKSMDAKFSTILKYAKALGLKELKISLG